MRLRRATPEDIGALLAIDAECFPAELVDRQPALPDEIAAGVEAGHVVLVEDRTGILGFVQVDSPGDDHLFIVAIDVRPDAQRRGVGHKLLRQVLDSVDRDDVTVSSVSATDNLGMLKLLLGHGFVVSAVIRDYQGPGNDRFYYQYRRRNGLSDREHVYLVPFTNAVSVYEMLDSPDYVITAMVSSTSSGMEMFEISRVEIGDQTTLHTSESTVGIIFSTAVLLLVVWVFDEVIGTGVEPVVFMMVAALLASIGSLVVRVSMSGDSLRYATGRFEQHMIWGGVLSEYGGVLPVAVVVPVLVGIGSTSRMAAVVLGLATTIVLLAYEFSPFSIQSKYSGWVVMSLLAVTTSLLPLIGVLLPFRQHDAYELWVWAVVAVGALSTRAILMGRVALRTVTANGMGNDQTRA